MYAIQILSSGFGRNDAIKLEHQEVYSLPFDNRIEKSKTSPTMMRNYFSILSETISRRQCIVEEEHCLPSPSNH